MPADDFEIVYLTLADALELYAAIIGGTTADATNMLRSQPALEGALARPQSHAHYQDADLALQAAVLAHGIAEGQAFLDRNKRLALVAMLTFLEANGYRVDATDPELASWIIELSLDPPRCVIAGRSAGPPGRGAVGTGGLEPGRSHRAPERTGRVQAPKGPEAGRGAAWRVQTGAPPAQIGGSRLSGGLAPGELAELLRQRLVRT